MDLHASCFIRWPGPWGLLWVGEIGCGEDFPEVDVARKYNTIKNTHTPKINKKNKNIPKEMAHEIFSGSLTG